MTEHDTQNRSPETAAADRPQSPEPARKQPGILAEIKLDRPPFSGGRGCFFEDAALSSARKLISSGGVQIESINLQGCFAGVFGSVRSEEGEEQAVSLLVQKTIQGQWLIDGKAGAARAQTKEVTAVLIAALIDVGVHPPIECLPSDEPRPADEASPCVETPAAPYNFEDDLRPYINLFCEDVRAGILHWDESELRNILESLILMRIDSPSDELLGVLRGMGIKQVAEIYPCDEIQPEFLDCYAYTGARRATQELFWADFLANRRRELEALDCDIDIDDGLNLNVIDAEEWYGEIKTDGDPEEATDWFSFECGIKVDGQRVNIIPGIAKYLEGKPTGFSLTEFEKLDADAKVPVLVDTGRYVAIPAHKLKNILGILTELFDRTPLTVDEQLMVHPVRAAQLTTYEGEDKIVSKAPKKLLKLAEDIETLKPKVDVDAPEEFQATLRPYQQDGFEWLQFLREQGVGGILADDMGLGKTMQTLCHLHAEKLSGRADLPSLVLAPKSVVPGWAKEAKKFAPNMRVLTLQGADRKKYYSVLNHADLVVTSYPVLLRDAEELLNQPFHYVVLDEAHTIKNSRSSITRTAYRIDARHRLCLSGTPIENHLGEMWSQFHFLMPGFLGSEEAFSRCFRNPIEKYRDENRRKRLAERVAPFMLRRVKSLVAKDLPEKTEIIKKVELNDQQIEIYEAVRASLQKEVREEIARHGVEASQLLVLEALMKLRQVCCHPRLVMLPTAQKAETCAKFEMMMEWLPDMVKEGRRILIFSQFTRMLDIMEERLDKLGLKYQTLTGQSKDRGDMVDTFQAGKVPIFLISLRAGGTGITLTKADTVIHYDPWWNPALESQATDRAYRIGQQNPVFVYKLISEGTIEDKILMLQEKKRALFEGILEGTPQKLAFSEKELNNLLAPIG